MVHPTRLIETIQRDASADLRGIDVTGDALGRIPYFRDSNFLLRLVGRVEMVRLAAADVQAVQWDCRPHLGREDPACVALGCIAAVQDITLHLIVVNSVEVVRKICIVCAEEFECVARAAALEILAYGHVEIEASEEC